MTFKDEKMNRSAERNVERENKREITRKITREMFANNSSEIVRKAFWFAEEAHKGQVDKSGRDYINHPMTVASFVSDDEICTVTALLHDVVEDTDTTFEDLEIIFPIEVTDALKLLTHKKGVPYLEYVENIKRSGNAVAKRVKLADLKHNMDLTRLPVITDKDRKRVEEMYIPAKQLLETE